MNRYNAQSSTLQTFLIKLFNIIISAFKI
jgi:hypothetical protein